MWLNHEKVTHATISAYRKLLLSSCPNYIVVDNLFNEAQLDHVLKALKHTDNWATQRHTYSELYVDNIQWQETDKHQRFVQRDVWQPETHASHTTSSNVHNYKIANDFLQFLRGDEFMAVLSQLFKVKITDINVEDPKINTNYFRLSTADFIEQHADDSPGREVCMLLYLNKDWNENSGGELIFMGKDESISIAPIYNRCVFFDPSSKGSEHWVKKLNGKHADRYRYNVTSWYWSE